MADEQNVGGLSIEIGADLSAFREGLARAEADIAGFATATEAAAQDIAQALTALDTAPVTPTVDLDGLGALVDQADDAERALSSLLKDSGAVEDDLSDLTRAAGQAAGSLSSLGAAERTLSGVTGQVTDASGRLAELRAAAERSRAAFDGFEVDFATLVSGAGDAQANLARVAASAEQAGLSIADLEAAKQELDVAFRSATTSDERARIARLSAGYDQLSTTLQRSAGSTSAFRKQAGLANNVVLEFGRAVGDARFGINGVANNLEQIGANFALLSSQAGGARAAFSSLASSLAGPTGLLLGFTTLVALGPSVVSFFSRAGREARDAEEAFRDASRSLVRVADIDFGGVEIGSVAEGQELVASAAGRVELLSDALERVRTEIASLQTGAGTGFGGSILPSGSQSQLEALRSRADLFAESLRNAEASLESLTDATRELEALSAAADELNRTVSDTADAGSAAQRLSDTLDSLAPALGRLDRRRTLGVSTALETATARARVFDRALERALQDPSTPDEVIEALSRRLTAATRSAERLSSALKEPEASELAKALAAVEQSTRVAGQALQLGLVTPLGAAEAEAQALRQGINAVLALTGRADHPSVVRLVALYQEAQTEADTLASKGEALRRALDLTQALTALETRGKLGLATDAEVATGEVQALERALTAALAASEGTASAEVRRLAQSLTAAKNEADRLRLALDLDSVLGQDTAAQIQAGLVTPLAAAEARVLALQALLSRGLQLSADGTLPDDELQRLNAALREAQNRLQALQRTADQADFEKLARDLNALVDAGVITRVERLRQEVAATEERIASLIRQGFALDSSEVTAAQANLRALRAELFQTETALAAVEAGASAAASRIAEAFTTGLGRVFGLLSDADRLTLINLDTAEQQLREAFQDGTVTAEEFRLRLAQINDQRDELATGLGALRNVAKNAFGAAVDFVKELVAELARAIARALVLRAVFAAFGSSGGLLGAIGQAAGALGGFSKAATASASAATDSVGALSQAAQASADLGLSLSAAGAAADGATPSLRAVERQAQAASGALSQAAGTYTFTTTAAGLDALQAATARATAALGTVDETLRSLSTTADAATAASGVLRRAIASVSLAPLGDTMDTDSLVVATERTDALRAALQRTARPLAGVTDAAVASARALDAVAGGYTVTTTAGGIGGLVQASRDAGAALGIVLDGFDAVVAGAALATTGTDTLADALARVSVDPLSVTVDGSGFSEVTRQARALESALQDIAAPRLETQLVQTVEVAPVRAATEFEFRHNFGPVQITPDGITASVAYSEQEARRQGRQGSRIVARRTARQ